MGDVTTIEGARTADALPSYLVRMVDADSHEMIPIHLWKDAFGDAGERLDKLNMKTVAERGGNSMSRPDLAGDALEISYDNVWKKKGIEAPSAIDLSRRPAVMDEMGIDRQLVFPTFALIGLILLYYRNPHEFLKFDPDGVDPVALGRQCCLAHNEWAARVTKMTNGRTRPVGVVVPDSARSMVAQAERIIDQGVRAIMLPAATPPADTSPADRSLDPFWALLEKHDVPFVLHLGTEFGLFASTRWSANVPEFAPSRMSSVEFQIEPYRSSILHYCMENFITTMILGGVLERFARLRVGIIETGAQWVASLAERLDMWAGEFEKRLAGTLSMPPSGYLARNVRITPFYFENIGSYFARRPDLASVYCFSTDYPHVEGGVEAHKVFAGKLDGFSDDIKEKFFRGNGMLLTPD